MAETTIGGAVERNEGRLVKLGAAMANIANGGVTLPSWFLAVAATAFLTATGSMLKMGFDLSETVATDHAAIQRNTDDIRSLIDMKSDVASMNTQIADMKDDLDVLVRQDRQPERERKP